MKMSIATTTTRQSDIIGNHDDVPVDNAHNPLTPKLRKGAKSKYIIEEHPILDGIGKVVRTRHTGDMYHCFFYCRPEKKWLRKSLHTRKLSEALEAGRKLIMTTLTLIEMGERVFNKTYQQVVDEHLKEKQEEADAKMITQGRVTTIRSALKWAVQFAGGPDKSITVINGIEWKRYYVWRRNLKPEVRDVTLVNERSAITALFRFADQKRYISPRHLPIFDKSISKNRDVERRDALTESEYNHLCSILRYFDKHGKNDKERNERRFIRDFFMISANTGLRFGEMRRLKWHQVTILSLKDDKGNPLCEIKLEKNDTKNKKARIVQGMRGDFFDRIKEYAKHKKPTDYVFADNESETGEQLPKKIYYSLWHELMDRAGLHERDKLTWYSLRHTYATFRLLNGKDLDVFTLAKNMGTSVKFIEDHYGHVETAQKRKELVSKKEK